MFCRIFGNLNKTLSLDEIFTNRSVFSELSGNTLCIHTTLTGLEKSDLILGSYNYTHSRVRIKIQSLEADMIVRYDFQMLSIQTRMN